MQIFVNGMINGLTLAVLALGFTLVYLPTRVFALALAGIYALTPYLVWQAQQWDVPLVGAIIVALSLVVLLNLAIEWFNHRPLVRRSASASAHMISSLGIFIIIIQIVALCWGNETRVLRTSLDATLSFGNVNLTRSQIIAACISLIILIGFYSWLRCTKLGLQFRALADNPIQLALHGFNTNYLRLLAAGMAGLLTGISSILVANDVGFDPHSGLNMLLLAIVATIVGGRHSFFAPILGGLLIGVLRVEVVWFLSARWQETATFLLLVLILFFRPRGLLGTKERLEINS